MSKLSKLKKYFSISDTAKYLSNVLEEPVSVADIYELAIEGKLKISARLIDRAYAISTQLAEEDNKQSGGLIKLPDGKRLALNEQIQVIDGIWELAMIGMELHSIKAHYQREISGPEPRVNSLPGFYVCRDGKVYKLVSSLPLRPREHVGEVLSDELENLLKTKGLTYQDLLDNDAVSLLECMNDEELEEFTGLTFVLGLDDLAEHESSPEELPLKPYSYQLVITTSEIGRLLDSLDESRDKPESSRERNNKLVLIGALLEELNIDPHIRGVTSAVQALLDLRGVSFSDDYIRETLKHVVIAMESKRNKS
ncbi:hypothetical protein BA953_05485 [Vibrio coralliilyticus]|uniref:hypothetical protein n=1 Tax=Vibrio coralliilyticus TaxID=190893 RepID=UPI0008108E2E|nr:hypothetical protein [Vibrio coralliilyticus]ANW23714.1 hypothetical protein BA953_05485 [Vibrio coralliilyticus]